MNELAILASLLAGPSYGYAMKKTAGLVLGRGELHPNLVYPMLCRFLRRGWVVQTVKPGERGQERKQYRITEKGRGEVLRQIAGFSEQDAMHQDAFLLHVALFHHIAPAARLAILALRKRYLRGAGPTLAEFRKRVCRSGFAAKTLDFSMEGVKLELRWIEQLERQAKRMVRK